MNILATNDDGFDAPGLQHLIAAMDGLGTLMVAAPDKNHSGASSALTLTKTITVYPQTSHFYRICGTPSDCVHLALTGGFLPAHPDLIVSGINDGENMGDDTIYSGTVAAAIEGHLFGIPAFAFSMAGRGAQHFAAGGAVARRFVMQFQQKQFAGLPLFNINIPDNPNAASADIVATRLGRRHPAQAAISQGENDEGGKKFVIGEAGKAQDNTPGTDFDAVTNGKISVTPLMIDLTNSPQISRIQQWFNS
ncbi:MAG: 5'/3'-nucleotidase SurE [Gammaproteobacteria bacterium WSBS_2016_MAG_OTU1]